MHVDLVGVRREIVALLRIEIAARNDALARLPEALHGVRHLPQLAQAGAAQRREFQVDDLDAIIVTCMVKSRDHVRYQRLWRRIANEFSDRPVVRITGNLLHQGAHRLHDQSCFLRHQLRRLARQGPKEDQEDEQQEQQVQELAKSVHTSPERAQESQYKIAATHTLNPYSVSPM